MKKNFMLFGLASIFLTALNLQTARAQYWKLGGNTIDTNSILGTNNFLPLRIFTSSSERMRVDAFGRVGIGTISPLYKLDVAGRMRVRAGGGTAGTFYMNAANTLDAAFIGMESDNSVGLWGSSGANWGLVMNTATADVSLASGNLVMGSAAKTIQFATPVVGSAPMVTMFPSGFTNADRMVISHSPLYPSWGLQYQDVSDKFNFLAGGIPVLTADLAGQKVGVGTSSPGYKLDVAGRMRVQSGGGTAGTWYMNAANTADAAFIGMASDNSVGLWGNSGAGWGLVMNTNNADVSLATGNLVMGSAAKTIQFATPVIGSAPMITMFPSGTANTDRMVISHSPSYPTWGLQYQDASDKFNFLSAGNPVLTADLAGQKVGIGTAFPAYKLDVCGTIRAKEIRVETGWCDYVFDKSYKLKSIDELEKFINDNKHLPGIVPAAEVEKEGLKVGEMNKAMMEKIEELSLYVIQLAKENKNLQTQINLLKK